MLARQRAGQRDVRRHQTNDDFPILGGQYPKNLFVVSECVGFNVTLDT